MTDNDVQYDMYNCTVGRKLQTQFIVVFNFIICKLQSSDSTMGCICPRFSVSQARLINKHKNSKEKVLKYNANCYFNKQCILRNLHNYAEPRYF